MSDDEFHIRVFCKALPAIQIRCDKMIKRWGRAIAILLKETVCAHANVVLRDDDTMVVTFRSMTACPDTIAIKAIVQSMVHSDVEVSTFEWMGRDATLDESWRDVDAYALVQLYDVCEHACLTTRDQTYRVNIVWDRSIPPQFPCLGIPGYWIAGSHHKTSFVFSTEGFIPAALAAAPELEPIPLSTAEEILSRNDFGFPVLLWCADQEWVGELAGLLRDAFRVRVELVSTRSHQNNAIACRMGPRASRALCRPQDEKRDVVSIAMRQITVRAFRVVDVKSPK